MTQSYFRLGDIMGRNERDRANDQAAQESRQAMPNTDGNSLTNESPMTTNRSPDLRRRALIAGLASTPVLLSLTNRSALGQGNVNCSLLYSVMLGGSVDNLPNGFQHKNEGFIENYYQTHCVEGGPNGTGNATGNSGQTGHGTGNTNGNATGNSGNSR
jgi:hypothetical protein